MKKLLLLCALCVFGCSDTEAIPKMWRIHHRSPTPTPTATASVTPTPTPTATPTVTSTPTSTPTPTLTPTATPTATITPTSTPSPTPTPTFLSARGILGGGADALTNAHVQGKYKKYYFIDLEPKEGIFFWSDIDNLLSSANGKQIVILLNLNSGVPSRGVAGLPKWLIDKGATSYSAYNSNHDTYLYQFLPWDPIFQSEALKLIAAIGDRYDGQLASVTVGGFGPTSEWGVPNPSPDGKTNAEANAAWIVSSKVLLAGYAVHLHKTTFSCALAQGGLTDASLQNVVDWALAQYGSRVGFENWSLKKTSSTSFLPIKIIYDHRQTNPVGFQMAGAADPAGGGAPIGGTLREVMEVGAALLQAPSDTTSKGKDIQVFGIDTANSDNAADLDAISVKLLSLPIQ